MYNQIQKGNSSIFAILFIIAIVLLPNALVTSCKSNAVVAQEQVQKEQRLSQLKIYTEDTWVVKQINLYNQSGSTTNVNEYQAIIENSKGDRKSLKANSFNDSGMYAKLQNWMLAENDQ